MIKFVVARYDEANYANYIGFSLQKIGNMPCIDIHANADNDSRGLAQKFNSGIDAYIGAKIDDQDIICFCHEDVKIIDPNFRLKLEKVFNSKPDIGLVGVAGGTTLPENANWFMSNEDTIRGQWIQDHDTNTVHMKKNNVGYFDDVVVIHKFFLAVRGLLFKEGLRFDESFIAHDLYNVDLGLQVLERGYKLAVADILLQHRSSRENNGNVQTLHKKWTEKGYSWPLTINQFKSRVDDVGVEVEI